MKTFVLTLAWIFSFGAALQSAEVKVSSPDGKAVITVTDAGGLSYAVFLDGREVVGKSRFGIVADGVDLGADVTAGQNFFAQNSRIVFDVRRPFAGGKQLPRNHGVRPHGDRRKLRTRRARLQ